MNEEVLQCPGCGVRDKGFIRWELANGDRAFRCVFCHTIFFRDSVMLDDLVHVNDTIRADRTTDCPTLPEVPNA